MSLLARKPCLAPTTLRPALIYAAFCAALSGCVGLQTALEDTVQLAAPEVELERVELVETPSQRMLQAYLCPRVLAQQVGVAAAAELACRQFFGPAPNDDDLQLGFDLHFAVKNDNRVPLPLSALLTAVRVFPEATESELGASCVRFCGPEDAACAAEDDPCRPGATDVTEPEQVRSALGRMLVAEGVRLAQGGKPELERPSVPAHASLALVARFSIVPSALLPALEQLARQSVREFERGEDLSFAIPYRLEGTLFADGGSLGRLSAPYGPLSSTFQLPVERLIAQQGPAREHARSAAPPAHERAATRR